MSRPIIRRLRPHHRIGLETFYDAQQLGASRLQAAELAAQASGLSPVYFAEFVVYSAPAKAYLSALPGLDREPRVRSALSLAPQEAAPTA